VLPPPLLVLLTLLVVRVLRSARRLLPAAADMAEVPGRDRLRSRSCSRSRPRSRSRSRSRSRRGAANDICPHSNQLTCAGTRGARLQWVLWVAALGNQWWLRTRTHAPIDMSKYAKTNVHT